MEETELKGSDFMTNFLTHYGTKGMKWGVRKKSKSSDRSNGVFKRSDAKFMRKVKDSSQISDYKNGDKPNESFRVYSNSNKGVLGVKGGSGTQVSDDAEIASVIREVAKTNTISSLTNNQLELVTRRMTLEMNYESALEKRYPQKDGFMVSAGKKFMKQEVKDYKGGKTPKSFDFIKEVKYVQTTSPMQSPKNRKKALVKAAGGLAKEILLP